MNKRVLVAALSFATFLSLFAEAADACWRWRRAPCYPCASPYSGPIQGHYAYGGLTCPNCGITGAYTCMTCDPDSGTWQAATSGYCVRTDWLGQSCSGMYAGAYARRDCNEPVFGMVCDGHRWRIAHANETPDAYLPARFAGHPCP